MSRASYIWILVLVAFAFWFHGYEEGQQQKAISAAAEAALFFGAKAGCEQENHLRDQVWLTAKSLHPYDQALVRGQLSNQNCTKVARRVVRVFMEVQSRR